MEYTIRKASTKDIPFIIEAIIEAEKSGTDKLGLSTLFDLTEIEVKNYLSNIFNEEIDGCEFSISSFLIAENKGNQVAAVGGWIEGANEEKLPSSILKANLISYCFPIDKVANMKEKSDIISGVQIERKDGSYQIEYVYVRPEYRGHNLIKPLIEEHIKQAKLCKQMFVQVFLNNISAIYVYKKLGFEVNQTFHSENKETKNYLPDNTKILMLKRL